MNIRVLKSPLVILIHIKHTHLKSLSSDPNAHQRVDSETIQDKVGLCFLSKAQADVQKISEGDAGTVMFELTGKNASVQLVKLN